MNDDGFLDNCTALEHYYHDAVTHYHPAVPWGCLLGRLLRMSQRGPS